MTNLHKIRNLYREWQKELISSNKFFCDLGKLLPTLPPKEKECKEPKVYKQMKRLGIYKEWRNPLDELEEIEEIKGCFSEYTLSDKINSLIKNQKILIDYIKSLIK